MSANGPSSPPPGPPGGPGPMFPPGMNIADFTVSPLIGALLNWGLFGVLSVQVYIYHLNFSDDKKVSKVLVYGVYLIEVAQTILSAVDIWYWFGVGFGSMDHLLDVYTSPWNTPLLCGIVALVVQLFFAYRIWTIQQQQRGGIVVVGAIVATALVQMAGSALTAYEANRLGRLDLFPTSSIFTLAYYMWLLGCTIADILIAAAMLWILFSNRNRSIGGSSKLLARLVKLIIETNTLTATFALLSFVLKVSMPNNSLFIVTSVVMGKLYANTLLVTFNNRLALRNSSSGSAHSGSGGSHQRAPSYSVPSKQSSLGNRISAGQTLVNPNQKSSFFNVDQKSDVFGFRESDTHGEDAQRGGRPRDEENIQIEVLRSVDVSKGTVSFQDKSEGRDVSICRRCGCQAEAL